MSNQLEGLNRCRPSWSARNSVNTDFLVRHASNWSPGGSNSPFTRWPLGRCSCKPPIGGSSRFRGPWLGMRPLMDDRGWGGSSGINRRSPIRGDPGSADPLGLHKICQRPGFAPREIPGIRDVSGNPALRADSAVFAARSDCAKLRPSGPPPQVYASRQYALAEAFRLSQSAPSRQRRTIRCLRRRHPSHLRVSAIHQSALSSPRCLVIMVPTADIADVWPVTAWTNNSLCSV